MTTIKATCPCCGEVSLTPPDVALHVDPDGAEPSTYAFQCPDCGDTVRKHADDRVIRLLRSGGVEPQPPTKQGSPSPSRRFDGPELTHDDLLDFHTLLQRADWFDQLLEAHPDPR